MVVFALSAHSQNAELEALLNAGIEGLMKATIVSASKLDQKLEDVAAQAEIITSKEIRERGYSSLDDLLSDLPGFQFRNIQGFNSYIFQRGIPNQNNLILVMIDGVQVNELNSGGFYGGSQYLLSNIKQVEIVYGPASSLYGTNAISGIINLITFKPEDLQGLRLNASAGSFSTFNINSDYGYYNPEKKFGFRVAGGYFSTEKTPLEGADGDNNWTDSLENFEKDLSLDLSLQFKQLSMGMNVQNKRASRATNYKSVGTDYEDVGTLWNIGFVNGYLQYDYRKKGYAFTPKLYYRNSTVLRNTIAFVTDTSQTGYYRPGNLLGIDLMNQFNPVKNLKMIGSVVLETENVAENYSTTTSSASTQKPPKPEKPDLMNNRLLSLYLQADYSFLKYFEAVAGMRYDNSSYYGEVLTPRISLAFHRSSFSSRLLYNEAFRAPRPWDYTAGTGNPDLKPETLKSFEWINACKISDFGLVSVSLYKNYLKNIITTIAVENGWKSANAGHIETEGIELTLKIRKKKISSWINYTFTNSENENEISIPEISKHTANAGFYYYISNTWNVGLRANYSGKRKNASLSLYPPENNMLYTEIDPAMVFHFSTGIAVWKNLECMLFINNILNTKYYHTSNRPPDRYRQAERYIELQLALKIQ